MGARRAAPYKTGGNRGIKMTYRTMATLEEALHDPHFIERGLFAHQVAGPTGATMPALPVPIDPQFRGDPRNAKAVPRLNE